MFYILHTLFPLLFTGLLFLCGWKVYRNWRAVPPFAPHRQTLLLVVASYWYLSAAYLLLAVTPFLLFQPAVLAWAFLGVQALFLAGFIHVFMVPLVFQYPEWQSRVLKALSLLAFFVLAWGMTRFRYPYVRPDLGVIVWNMDPFFALFLALLFLILLLPTAFFYLYRAGRSGSRPARNKALLMSVGLFALAVSVFFWYMVSFVFQVYVVIAFSAIGCSALFLSVFYPVTAASGSNSKPTVQK